VINANRANIEATRRRWLHAHRHLFDPLLPPSSTFFANVSQELDAAGSDADYVPFKELDEQPKLIETATLKDYQLHGVSWLVYMHKNGWSLYFLITTSPLMTTQG
jgi:SWI/SNF-related matrix-associated actin-dependent regulator of chromatin subfamily A member 5